jgi:hypothetical protein
MPKKFSYKQERDAAISYLCGVSPIYIQENCGISVATLIRNIIGNRSYAWNDKLLEFYRQTKPRKRLRNSAHLYLAFRGKDIPQGDLISLQRDENINKAVEDDIYDPRIMRIIEKTCLERFFAPTNGLEILINAIFGKRTPKNIIEPILVDILHQEYQKTGEFSLKNVYKYTEDALINKIKHGAMGITPRKAEFFYETLAALKGLTEKERGVLSHRFGLHDGKRRTLKEVGKMYNLSVERIRMIEAIAIRKLKHPKRYKEFDIIACLTTDEELGRYIAKQEEAKKRDRFYRELYPDIEEDVISRIPNDINLQQRIFERMGALTPPIEPKIFHRSIAELELSYRPLNRLMSTGICTIGEAMQKTDEELLRINNFGKKSLVEVRQALLRLGLRPTWHGKTTKSKYS